jgi:YidC/Oxa1 family membrane protein insertase
MLTNFFYNLVVAVTSLVPGHYIWVSIVLITILLRLAFVKSSVSMVKMQHKQKSLQGEMDELKKVHKGDKQAEQKALMDLYKRENFNPLSSCLPVIVQLIVFIAFYRVFTRVGISNVNTSVLYSFVPHLTSMNSSFFGVDLAKKVSQLVAAGGTMAIAGYIFPILTGGSQLLQSLQTKAMQPTGGSGESFQKALTWQMTFLFPIMTAYISYSLPAALSIYWVTQTVFMVVQQQYIITHHIPKSTGVAIEKPKNISKSAGVVVEVRQKKQ